MIVLWKIFIIVDIYHLNEKKEELTSLEGYGNKSISNLLISIENSKKNSLERLLNGLGINGIGLKSARLLAEKYETMSNLMNASFEELLTIKDIGEVLANNIVTYFSNPTNRILIRELEELGVNMTYTGKKAKYNLEITGKKFVITGTIDYMARDKIKEIILAYGGYVAESVSKNTDIVICGHDAGSKYDKAKSLNIPIWDADKLAQVLEGLDK